MIAPDRDYVAATEAAAILEDGPRARLVVEGRSPRQMLNGILTGTIPQPPSPTPGSGVPAGTATYHAVLTPKGKMITDLWCLCRDETEDSGDFVLDVPGAGLAGLREHLGKFLPPRFAKVTDVSGDTGSFLVVGPAAAAHLARSVFGLRVDASELSGLAEGGWLATGSPVSSSVVVVRSGEVWPEAFMLYGPAGALGAVETALVDAGVTRAGPGVRTLLRVEAGRPAYGVDMDEGTIPIEAGIHDRAIDYRKGCYTGQEVIVRIRDRGHVNRHLRQIMLGDLQPPPAGTELFLGESEKPVGKVTSAVRSPRFGQTVALAYVRRGTEGTPLPR